MKNSFLLWFLYRTIPGRMVLKILVQPWVSKTAGYFLSSGMSRWLVPYYIWKHKINMRDIEVPENGFLSFNEFFTRKKNTMCFNMTCGYLISPCDGFLTFTKISENQVFDVKNTKFSLEDLLEDSKLAAQFCNGNAFVFRLTPANYHRYCYAEGGRLLFSKKIQGKLHCVRPIAVRTMPVFAQNSREYQVCENQYFGMMIQMEIGALLVGKINNHKQEGEWVKKGDEKGYFEFGGSTIIVLLQKDTGCFRKELYHKQNRDGEIPVHMGEFIAELK